ncbi:MAG: hypothetical protein U0271_05405 [Polyangiaceae bacterium]
MRLAIPNYITFNYTRLFDWSLEKVADRYRTTAEAIRQASTALFPDVDISDHDKFKAALKSNHDVVIPVSSDVQAFDWEIWSFGKGAKYKTVKKLCEDAEKDPRRATVPKMTAEDLLKSVANTTALTTLRKLFWKADPTTAPTKTWFDYANHYPSALVPVLVPFPRVTSDIAVAVAPKPGATSGSATPSVVEAAPPWLVTFYCDYLKPLDDALAELVEVNETCNRIKEQAANELALFGAVAEAARMMRDSEENHDDPIAWNKRNELVDQLTDFVHFAHGFMAVDVVARLERPEAGRRVELAKDVLERLQDPAAVKGVVKILTEPDLQIALTSKLRRRVCASGKAGKGERISLKGYVILLALVAIQETAHSRQYEDAVRLVDRALKKFGTAKKSAEVVTPDPEGWLDAIVSVIGVATMFVGDAPGPQALGMSLACIAATWGPAWARANFGMKVWASDKLTWLAGWSAGMKQPEIEKFQARVKVAARAGNTDEIGEELQGKVEAGLWQGKGWNIGMGIVSALCLYAAFEELRADPSKEEAYLGVAAAGSGFFAAALKTLVMLDTKGGYLEASKLAGDVAGGVAAALGIAIAVVNAARTYDKYGMINEVWYELGSAAASAVVLAGFLMSCPGTQAIGLILGLSFMVLSYEGEEKSTFMCYLESVAEDSDKRESQLKRLMAVGNNGALEKAYKELVLFAKTFDYYGEITNSKANRERLKKLRFSDDAIYKLTSYSEV